jgi:hypothetical protein
VAFSPLPGVWVPTAEPGDAARDKVDEVAEHADCLNAALLPSPELFTYWGSRWASYYAETKQWEQKSREDLSDFGTNTIDGPRITDEGNERLRQLRTWQSEAVDRNVKMQCETPPDLVNIGLGIEVPRWSLYAAGGVLVVGLGLLASREARAWAGLAGSPRRRGNPSRRRRRRA